MRKRSISQEIIVGVVYEVLEDDHSELVAEVIEY